MEEDLKIKGNTPTSAARSFMQKIRLFTLSDLRPQENNDNQNCDKSTKSDNCSEEKKPKMANDGDDSEKKGGEQNRPKEEQAEDMNETVREVVHGIVSQIVNKEKSNMFFDDIKKGLEQNSHFPQATFSKENVGPGNFWEHSWELCQTSSEDEDTVERKVMRKVIKQRASGTSRSICNTPPSMEYYTDWSESGRDPDTIDKNNKDYKVMNFGRPFPI